MYLEMKVCGFTIDSLARLPVVILKDAGEKNTLPIWINSTEAVSLAAQLISRDMSVQSGCCELMTKLMDQLRLKVARTAVLNTPGEDLDSTIDASRYIDFLENLDPKKMGSYPM